MLSRIDKIIVHSFGLFVNFMFINFIQLVNVCFFDNYSLTLAYLFFFSTMVWNLIPILNSDGYKIMLAALSLDEFNNFTKKPLDNSNISNHWYYNCFKYTNTLDHLLE